MHTHTKALTAALLVALTGSLGAQQQLAGPRFQGWLGCWSGAVDPDEILPVVATQTLVCITPTEDANVVKVATVADGKVLSTHALDASGRERPLDAKGCTGVQSASWSADERRVYLKSTAQCGGVTRATSGILSITARGEWLDVQQVMAGGAENVRVMRYFDAGVPSWVPAEIASTLSDRGMATRSARIAAGANIGRAAVLEASKTVSPAVVESWVLERGQPFTLNASELLALADAGIAPRVIDAMVVVSNPKEFSVARRDYADRRPMADTTVVGRRLHVYLDRNDPYSWGYDPYGYSLYDYRRGYYTNAYGYGPYGYGGSGYGSPVVVVTRPESQAHGRRVKGQGYEPPPTQNQPTPSRRARERDRSTDGGSSTSSSSSGSSSSSESSRSAPSSSPAPSSTRTAQPKPQ